MKNMTTTRSFLAAMAAIALTLALLAGAAHAGSGRVMQEVTTTNPTGGISDKDFVYFGTKPSSGYVYRNREGGLDPKWWVLDADADNTGASGAMFLLAQDLWGTGGTRGNVYFDDTSPYSNRWQGSTAQTWCNTFVSDTVGVFSPVENAAIRAITKTDATTMRYSINWGTSSLSDEKV
ncbi:MAG: hypothetical protein IJR14_02160, partial [Synergistaceae bacterium]|nr:hypothetical protein [Synergistaceae bacterium]